MEFVSERRNKGELVRLARCHGGSLPRWFHQETAHKRKYKHAGQASQMLPGFYVSTPSGHVQFPRSVAPRPVTALVASSPQERIVLPPPTPSLAGAPWFYRPKLTGRAGGRLSTAYRGPGGTRSRASWSSSTDTVYSATHNFVPRLAVSPASRSSTSRVRSYSPGASW